MGMTLGRIRLAIRGEETVELTNGTSDSSSSSTPSMNGVSESMRTSSKRKEADESPIRDLPQDLLLRIFSFLDVISKCRCAQVCQKWHSLALDGSNWQRVNLFDFQTSIEGQVVVQLSRRCGGFLHHLNLQNCRSVEDQALITFARNCRNINELILRHCVMITDRTIESISQFCKELKLLDLSSCKNITNHSCRYLRNGCPELESVDLSHCTKINSEGIDELAKGCPSMKTFVLNFCPEVGDHAIRSIAQNCQKLQQLRIRCCRNVTDVSFQMLCAGCPRIQRLDISNCERLTDATLRALGTSCPQLRILEAAECGQFSDAGFKALTEGCLSLQKLDLEECILITDVTLLHLSQQCHDLQSLVCSHCERVTDEGVRQLMNGTCATESLQVLELDNCPLITDISLSLLCQCTSLRRLEVFDCQHVSREAIERLKLQRPELHVQAYFAPSTAQTPPANPTRTVICRCCTIL